jgi:hypothetical protein
VTRFAKRTARSARRYPLLALLCVLVVVGGSGAAVALATPAPSVPPVPLLTTYPPDPNGTATSTFVWTDSQAGVTFLCSVENGKFSTSVIPPGGGPTQPCSSPLTYNVSTSNNGTHQFAVEAVDAYGNVSTPTKYSWKVPKTALPLRISGNAGTVYPGGASSPFGTTIYNPNTGPVTINSLTVSLDTTSSLWPSVCQPGWFTLSQSNVSTGNPLTVPGGSSVTLPQGTVSAPNVSMIDSGDQSSCENKPSIPVSYDNTFSASFAVGGTSLFTFTIVGPSGGPMYPAGGTGTYETETYKVTNPSPGAQNLNHVVISVANSNGSAWSSQTNGARPACTKNDFELSLDGTTWAAAGASVTDTSIAADLAGGATSAQHTLYIRMRDNGLNQDNCQGLTNVPLYYYATG